jgi:predicted nucleotidyltransferase/HEPN domain-containing protein
MSRSVRTLSHPDMSDPSILTRIAERLERELGAEAVILYGSVVRGEATADSDIDLLVIAPSAEDFYRRTARARAAIRDLRFGVPVSPLVLTPDEVRQRLEADDRFIRQIIETGLEVSHGPGRSARLKWGGIRPMPGARASDSWREHAKQDWQRMHLHLNADDGGAAGFYLQQVIEKFLKGWLLDHGWQLRKTHDLEELLDAARAHDPTLISFRPLCERVSTYYFADRYPGAGGTSPDAEQVRLDAGEARLLVRALFPDEPLG